jgi:hypothetical protein
MGCGPRVGRGDGRPPTSAALMIRLLVSERISQSEALFVFNHETNSQIGCACNAMNHMIIDHIDYHHIV